MSHTVESMNSSLGHFPADDRWAFDESVTNVFADMLKRSIPQYDVMRKAVFDIGTRFVQPGTQILDVGCARGDALAPFIATYGSANRFVGVDLSKPMLVAAIERFSNEIANGFVEFSERDLRTGVPGGKTSLTLCVLTLQFTPLDHRQRILADIYGNTTPGGAVILVEKILGATAELGRTMIDLYHHYKAENGYTADEIERKRLSLEGVLVPVTARWNEEMLHTAGFHEIDCFWRWMNFAGWVAVKGR